MQGRRIEATQAYEAGTLRKPRFENAADGLLSTIRVKKMGIRRKARECALQMMFQLDITNDQRYLKERYWDENPCSEQIKDYANELVTGTLTHLSEIDSVISEYAENWLLSRMGRIDRNVLRLAVYELLYREDVPARVTLNEAIVIAKKFAEESSGAFINGILDKILKEDPKAKKKFHASGTDPVHVHDHDDEASL